MVISQAQQHDRLTYDDPYYVLLVLLCASAVWGLALGTAATLIVRWRRARVAR